MKNAWRLTGLLLATIGCSSQHSLLVSPGVEVRRQTTGAVAESGFTVTAALSGEAKKRLADGAETIVVYGYVTGNPKPGALKRYVNRMGEVELGEFEKEVARGETVVFDRVQVKQDALERTDKNNLQILINIFSGRKSSKDNLLDCAIYQGPLKSIQGRNVAISCTLIGE